MGHQILEKETEHLKSWLETNYQAGMEYMERNLEKRKDVREIFADCKSVISLGMNYFTDETVDEIENSGKVSRYAWGSDYHNVIWEKLDSLIKYTKLIHIRHFVPTDHRLVLHHCKLYCC